MTSGVDMELFAGAVTRHSQLSVSQVIELFGEPCAANKTIIWRYLTQMSPEQQKAIWDCHWYLKKSLAPDVTITSVERLIESVD